MKTYKLVVAAICLTSGIALTAFDRTQQKSSNIPLPTADTIPQQKGRTIVVEDELKKIFKNGTITINGKEIEEISIDLKKEFAKIDLDKIFSELKTELKKIDSKKMKVEIEKEDRDWADVQKEMNKIEQYIQQFDLNDLSKKIKGLKIDITAEQKAQLEKNIKELKPELQQKIKEFKQQIEIKQKASKTSDVTVYPNSVLELGWLI